MYEPVANVEQKGNSTERRLIWNHRLSEDFSWPKIGILKWPLTGPQEFVVMGRIPRLM
jgi:hypothetical protein